MTRSPLYYGLIYIAFGIILITMAAMSVAQTGETNFLIYLIAIFATFDIGRGIKLIVFHFKSFRKNKLNS